MVETYENLAGVFCKPEPKFHELRSYWELKNNRSLTLDRYGKTFFLDSGAFSAKNSGTEVSFNEYADFIERHKDSVDMYCNLDVIPENTSMEAKKFAAAKSFGNLQKYEAMGLKPMPVFHCNEPFEYLEYYVWNYDYIAIGGLVDDNISDFLAKCWTHYLLNPDGTPKIKVHGFGMTSLSLMQQWPWYSVDSTTWLVHSKYGIIAFPRKIATGWDYTFKPTLVGISDRSSMKDIEGTHYENMSAVQQEAIREYLDQYGFTPEDVAGHPYNRFIVNINYWLQVEKASENKIHVPKPKQLEIF